MRPEQEQDHHQLLKSIGFITVILMEEPTTQITLVPTADLQSQGMSDMQHIMTVMKVAAIIVTPEKGGRGEY